MSVSDSVLSCAEAVRTADFDRYLSVLFARRDKRAALFAIYAFNYEVAKTAEMVSESTLGLIRLQWWRETIAGIFEGTLRRHKVVLSLSNAINSFNLPRILFDGLIDAREQDLTPMPFLVLDDFENYADASSGNLMRLAARILGAGNEFDKCVRPLGIAYALTGQLRAMPYHSALRRLMLPMDEVTKAGLCEEDIYAGRTDNIRILMDSMIGVIKGQLVNTIKKIPRGALPAFLPAALIHPYLKIMTRAKFNIYSDPVELSVPCKQLTMMSAVLRGRL